jgi:hypothetical protein
MKIEPVRSSTQIVEKDWVAFPGGELEGERPKALCPACRAAPKQWGTTSAGPRPLCFQCYRAEIERQRALRAAGALDTASEARFQSQLPFEPIDRARLETLKAARADVRRQTAGSYEDRRRHAQIEARHALQTIAANLSRRSAEGAKADAVHAAELQLPESWLPYVVSR